MTDETTKQILSILNPLRVLKVNEWMEISDIIKAERIAIGKLKHDDPLLLWRDSYALSRIATYETITSLPLTKEMFVCEVEKPKQFDSFLAYGHEQGNPYAANHNKQMEAYIEAQSKVLFEGFFQFHNQSTILYDVQNVSFSIKDNNIRISDLLTPPHSVITIGDFIYQIDLYNRTATTPITLRVNENFVKNLLK